MRFATHWYECEHGGDVDRYTAVVTRAGGVVVASEVDVVAEEATLIVEAAERGEFLDRLMLDEDGDFCFEVWFGRKRRKEPGEE